MDTQKKQSDTGKKANLGLSLVETIKKAMKEEIEEHGELDEHWDLEIDRQVVEEVITSRDDVFEKLEAIIDYFYDDLVDEVTYEMRQGEAEERDKRRTDRVSFMAEKSRTANKINRKYN